MADWVVATCFAPPSSGDFIVEYDSISLQILGVRVSFAGGAHFRMGDPASTRRFEVMLNEPQRWDFSKGKRFYLQNTEDGLDFPPDFNFYVEAIGV